MDNEELKRLDPDFYRDLWCSELSDLLMIDPELLTQEELESKKWLMKRLQQEEG